MIGSLERHAWGIALEDYSGTGLFAAEKRKVHRTGGLWVNCMRCCMDGDIVSHGYCMMYNYSKPTLWQM